jgi:hypothetical protein
MRRAPKAKREKALTEVLAILETLPDHDSFDLLCQAGATVISYSGVRVDTIDFQKFLHHWVNGVASHLEQAGARLPEPLRH